MLPWTKPNWNPGCEQPRLYQMSSTGGGAKAPRTRATVSGKMEEKVTNQPGSATPSCVQYYEGPVLARFSNWDLEMEI